MLFRRNNNPPSHKQATSWKPYVEYTIIMAFQWYTHKQIVAGEGIRGGGWVAALSYSGMWSLLPMEPYPWTPSRKLFGKADL